MPTPAGSSAIQSSVARLWPRHGPAALSLEGASGCLLNREAVPMAQLKALPDGPFLSPGPLGGGATATRRGRTARTNPAQALNRQSPPEPEDETGPVAPLAS
jgi:hypothetical protein